MSVSKHSKASQTAAMIAGYRARASQRPGALFRDPWARALGGDEGVALSHEFDAAFPSMELWTALRTAYIDAHVAHWTGERGFRQVVLLGAGLDTRAARLARAGTRFYEVDHPATQASKLEALAALSDYPVDAARYVSCDFEHDDFLERLLAEGFDATSPALIVWEGVVSYLSEAAIRATLRRIASGCDPGSVVLFDYLSKRMGEGTSLRDEDAVSRQFVETLGEPVLFGSNHPLPLLYEAGFRHVRLITFDEICLSLTGSYDRAHMFRFQNMAVASCTAHDVI
ncbi:MAG: class I SAM-dependent methyltransferase [Myxococcales bacterium]|nr:class I SAM-dependent methyltransferase [Myxococcales bacterium]